MLKLFFFSALLLAANINAIQPTLLLLEGTANALNGTPYYGLIVTRIYSDDSKTNLVYSTEVAVEKGVFDELLGGDKPLYLDEGRYYLNLLIGAECSQQNIDECEELDLSEGVLAAFEVK